MQAATALSIIEAFEAANVPHDKARAVVEALEKEMFEQLATKADFQLMKTELLGEIRLVRSDVYKVLYGLGLTLGLPLIGLLAKIAFQL